MELDEVRQLAQQALCETSGKQAQVSLVIKQGSMWVILLRIGEDELAVKVEDTLKATPGAIQRELEAEIRKLF